MFNNILKIIISIISFSILTKHCLANTSYGTSALASITTGNYNSAFGQNSLFETTEGIANDAFGYNSLKRNTTGSYNSSVGSWSLFSNTTGSFNNAFGRSSLINNSTGAYNTAVGKDTLTTNTTGSNNLSMGYQSGYSNETGSGNIFIGYQSGYNETGSNKLYIDNSNTSSPLIYGDFDTNKLTVNGDMSVTGNLTANKIVDTSGNTIIRTDSSTGAIHIGANSMVFYDATSATGNGYDIMSSSVGKIQIGLNDTDTTTFKGNVHVPDPTASTHAASKRYVDSIGAVSMAMNSALTPRGDGTYFGIGTSVVDGQGAISSSLSFIEDKRLLNVVVGYNNLVDTPTLSGGVSWKF